MKTTIVLLVSMLSGCVEMLPNIVGPDVEHQSHISQHFGSDKSHYGSNIVGVKARWNWGHAYGELFEGANIGSKSPNFNVYGDTVGPRETTEVHIGYAFQVRP